MRSGLGWDGSGIVKEGDVGLCVILDFVVCLPLCAFVCMYKCRHATCVCARVSVSMCTSDCVRLCVPCVHLMRAKTGKRKAAHGLIEVADILRLLKTKANRQQHVPESCLVHV